MNARLSQSFTEPIAAEDGKIRHSPLSSILSRLNDSRNNETMRTPQFASQSSEESVLSSSSREPRGTADSRAVASPDLAMLAAASAKVESASRINQSGSSSRGASSRRTPSDERSRATPSPVQPNVNNQTVGSSPYLDHILHPQSRRSSNKGAPPTHEEFFGLPPAKDTANVSQELSLNHQIRFFTYLRYFL